MIDKERLLNDKYFYKFFKTSEDITSFFKQLHKRAVEHILEGELEADLDYSKHEKSTVGRITVMATEISV